MEETRNDDDEIYQQSRDVFLHWWRMSTCLCDREIFHSFIRDWRVHNDLNIDEIRQNALLVRSKREDWFLFFDLQLMTPSKSPFRWKKYKYSADWRTACALRSKGKAWIMKKKTSVAVYHNDRQLYLHSRCLECLSLRLPLFFFIIIIIISQRSSDRQRTKI